MIYLLFVMVVLLTMFNFTIQKGDILSPSFWACVMFMISIFVNLLNVDRWGTDYTWKAMGLILLGLLMIIVGEYFIKIIYKARAVSAHSQRNTSIQNEKKPIEMNGVTIAVFILISLLCLLADIRIMSGITEGTNVFSALFDARHILTSGEAKRGFIGRFVFAVNKGMAYIFIYVILYNAVFCKVKNKKGYFIPIGLFFIDAILSTGRTVFLRLIAYTFIIFVELYMAEHKVSIKQLKKIVKLGIAAVFAYFVIFTLLGKLLGKGQYTSAMDVIYIYAGSSINLFNQYIESGVISKNSYIGEHTLYGIYNILHYFISSIPHVSNPALEYRYLPHWNSNIYTAFRRYYQDFGVVGLMLISAFLGMYYGGLELDSRDHMKSGWKTIFFAYSIYPIIEIAIEERFFMQYISFSTMFELLVFRCMYIIIMRCRFTLGVSVKQEKSKIG